MYPPFDIISYVMVDRIPPTTPSFNYTMFCEEPGEIFHLMFDLGTY